MVGIELSNVLKIPYGIIFSTDILERDHHDRKNFQINKANKYQYIKSDPIKTIPTLKSMIKCREYKNGLNILNAQMNKDKIINIDINSHSNTTQDIYITLSKQQLSKTQNYDKQKSNAICNSFTLSKPYICRTANAKNPLIESETFEIPQEDIEIVINFVSSKYEILHTYKSFELKEDHEIKIVYDFSALNQITYQKDAEIDFINIKLSLKKPPEMIQHSIRNMSTGEREIKDLKYGIQELNKYPRFFHAFQHHLFQMSTSFARTIKILIQHSDLVFISWNNFDNDCGFDTECINEFGLAKHIQRNGLTMNCIQNIDYYKELKREHAKFLDNFELKCQCGKILKTYKRFKMHLVHINKKDKCHLTIHQYILDVFRRCNPLANMKDPSNEFCSIENITKFMNKKKDNCKIKVQQVINFYNYCWHVIIKATKGVCILVFIFHSIYIYNHIILFVDYIFLTATASALLLLLLLLYISI